MMNEMHMEGQSQTQKAKYLSYEDGTICRYIERHQAEDDYYDEDIAGEEAFGVHFHLSSLRRGILSWYDFEPDASLLEIGAGFGALTGLFCERCAEVTAVEPCEFRANALMERHKHYRNLQVIINSWQKIEFDCQFDYVVLFNSAQCNVEMLNQIATLLKPQGRLLISFENCFGMKYLCGVPEPYTGRFLGGIRGIADRSDRYTFSRDEIIETLQKSVFVRYKFYYPLPDDRLPQLIYTDDYLPEKNVMERLQIYYEESDMLLCSEDKLYGTVIGQGAFPYFSNSFLVECTRDGQTCDITYASVTSDRARERSFATTIHQNGLVSKKPLYPEGKESIYIIFNNTTELKERGIPIVPHTYEDQRITLPYVSFPTLANYIRTAVVKDSSIFIKVLKDLYAFVLQASEEADASENAMIPKMLQSYADDPKARERLEKVAWGPILKRTYLELIPLNCFYDEQNDDYMFFDQEFVQENYPAGFTMYRAIYICYLFISGLEEYVPLQQVKAAFGLESAWEFYEREEFLFLNEIRLRTRYRQFYKWMFARSDISADIRKLEYAAGRRKGRKLILFGTGKKFEDYCAKYAKKDMPVFAVDNDGSKWGQKRSGIEICPPEAILDIPQEYRQVLICCVDTGAIEEQLIRMGVKEYWRYRDIV